MLDFEVDFENNHRVLHLAVCVHLSNVVLQPSRSALNRLDVSTNRGSS